MVLNVLTQESDTILKPHPPILTFYCNYYGLNELVFYEQKLGVLIYWRDSPPKNENDFSIYSYSSHSKPVWPVSSSDETKILKNIDNKTVGFYWLTLYGRK